MTTDELIDLGHKAGALFVTKFGVASATTEWLEQFAALVAAAEREACAKVCDDKAKETFSGQCQVWGDYFARAIRARSKEQGMTDQNYGPWSVSMLGRPQLRPYYVCRQVSPTGWEQLHTEEGGVARFETMAEAQEAADVANAARSNT